MHICGDWLHDIIVNGVLLLAFLPAWLPYNVAIRRWAARFYQHRHHHHD